MVIKTLQWFFCLPPRQNFFSKPSYPEWCKSSSKLCSAAVCKQASSHLPCLVHKFQRVNGLSWPMCITIIRNCTACCSHWGSALKVILRLYWHIGCVCRDSGTPTTFHTATSSMGSSNMEKKGFIHANLQLILTKHYLPSFTGNGELWSCSACSLSLCPFQNRLFSFQACLFWVRKGCDVQWSSIPWEQISKTVSALAEEFLSKLAAILSTTSLFSFLTTATSEMDLPSASDSQEVESWGFSMAQPNL